MKLFIFNNQEQLIKVIEPLEAVSEEEINKIHKIEATLRYSDVFDSNNDISESATYVGHKDYDNGDIFHFYKIAHITKTSLTEVKLVGVNSFYDDMQSDGYIKDFRPTNKSVMSILQTLLEGSRWQLGIVKSTELVTLNFYYLSRKEAIAKLLEVANIEIRPRVELSKNTIIRRYLDVFTTLGADHGKVFTHGKDLLTVSEKASQGAIYTAAIGRGKGEEITGADGQATGGYGRRITFKDVVWRRNSGNPVDKPKGQEFVEIPELTAKYGFANGTKPRLKIIEFQDEEDPEKLLRLTYAWLEKNSRIQVEYKATVNNVGNCNLGDTVGIYNPTIGIKYKTRVFSVKRNLIDNNLTEFGIGDKVTTSPFSRTTEVAKNLKNLEDNTIYWLDQLRDKIKDNFLNEDGYNYDLGVNNKYHLPAGLYSFDKPIDQEPTKVVYVGAGKVAIANSKLPDGKWDWKTFLDGNGATLDLVNTGTLRAGIIQSSDGTSYWNLDTGEFKITQKAIEDVTYKAIEKQLKEKKDDLKGDSSYIHKKYSNNANGTPMTDDTNSKYMGIYTGTSKTPPVNASEYNWTKIVGEDGHSLNAYLRLEGSYLNSNIANFGAYVKVMYDGVQISNFDISHSYRGASFPETSNQASTVASNGLITNLGLNASKTDGTPLYVDITVKYKGLTSVASARLDNTVDVELVNNTINKFKTFESTLENFESTIKEIDKKKFKMAYNIENLCSETNSEKKGNDLYFNTKRPLEVNKYYYILAYLKNAPEGRFARIYYADDNGDNKLILNGLNVWRVKYNSPQTRVNIFSQGSDTTVKNVEVYEVPEIPFPEEDVLYAPEKIPNNVRSSSMHFRKSLQKNTICTAVLDVEGETDKTLYFLNSDNLKVQKRLVTGKNYWTFLTPIISNSRDFEIIGTKGDVTILQVLINHFDKGYKNEYNISDMESSIKQTKASIDLSVKKNEVINSINLSGEGVKINADKVDISGTLNAYTGNIGGFKIGHNPNDGGYWLTGTNNFDCGINPGHNVGTRGVQLWAAWGNNWTNPSDRAWSVNASGEMACRGKAYFGSEALFSHRPTFNNGVLVNGNIQVTGNIFYNNGEGSSGYWTYSSHYKSIQPSSDGRYVYFSYSGGGSDWIPLNKEISDRRFKRDIQPSTVNGLEIINNLKTYSYTKEYDGKTEDIECGIMAQDVKEHAKSAFQEAPEEVQTYSTFKLVPYLIKAVQELSEKVENLEKQLKERSSKDGI